MMNDSSFQRLLNSAVNAACKHNDLMEKVHKEIEVRYGHSYSDIDCDTVIDKVNYGQGGYITVSEVHNDLMLHLERKGLLNDDGSIKRDGEDE